MIQATSNFLSANAAQQKEPIYLLEIDGYWRVFTNKAVPFADSFASYDDWMNESFLGGQSCSVNDLDGGADLGSIAVTVDDVGAAITGDFSSFGFEGKPCRLKTGFVGLAYADFVTLFTGKVDTVDQVNQGSSYVFNCVNARVELAEVIYQTADDGFPTDQDHHKTLLAHPLDILLNILLTQLALPADLVRSSVIEAYRDGPFAGQMFKFELDSPPAAMDFIEQQIMQPLGGYCYVDSSGRVTVKFFVPIAEPDSVFSITESNTVNETPDTAQADLLNQVTMKFDKSLEDGKPLSIDVESFQDSIARFGLFGGQVIEADGMRSAFQGFLTSAMTSRLLFYRYGSKNIKLDKVPLFWTACVLEHGDIVDATYRRVTDREAGSMGITARLFEVLDVDRDFKRGVVSVTLLDARYLGTVFGQFVVAADDEDDYAASGNKATVMFMTDDDGKYSNDDDGNILG